MSAISIVNVKKNYGTLAALKGINLEIKKGEFFGLLGPNGAGKTTLIHSIVGLCKPSAGSIQVHGHDVRKDLFESHQKIGFSPQDMNLDRFFSIRQILFYQAGFYGIPRGERYARVDRLLETFQLTEKASAQYYRLSGGMQKRVLIAKALVGNPEVLILDEPTAGIDVEQRHHLWGYLNKLNSNGTTIILTTHTIDEAEVLCERIGIMHLGEVREMGSPKELIKKYCEKKVILTTSQPIDHAPPPPHPRAEGEEGGWKIDGNCLTATGKDVGIMLQACYQFVAQIPNCRIEDIHVEQGSLEEVFLKVTGSKIE